MNPQKELVKFSDVSFSYSNGKNLVLNEFDLGIGEGNITAILGPNGAGKTTLLQLTLGWLQPRQGSISLNDQPLGSYSRRKLGQWMALVPQNEHMAFAFSILDYVLLGRAPYLPPLGMPSESDYQVAEEALERVGLSDLRNRSVLKLSGGERQLVLLARAIAQKPLLLLLDEPTSHLDLGNKGRLVGLLRDLQAQGVTIVFTTHEPDVASALATHLVLMQAGQVLETGGFSEVFNSESLSRLYKLPVDVRQIGERRLILWG